MKVIWAPSARRDLIEIADFISETNPMAAMAVLDRLGGAAENLAAFPTVGRRGRKVGTRELFVSDLPYVLIYRPSGEHVEIIRALHTARSRPDRL